MRARCLACNEVVQSCPSRVAAFIAEHYEADLVATKHFEIFRVAHRTRESRICVHVPSLAEAAMQVADAAGEVPPPSRKLVTGRGIRGSRWVNES